jgi:uncharacterized protein
VLREDNKMFKFLSKIITNWPVKTLSIILVLMLVFAVGARNIRLATSNDTLIATSNEVYQNNLYLESEFGGEAIIVLFEGKEVKDLLTPESINTMNELENRLKQYDEIYTIVSPSTVIRQISQKQYEKYKSGIKDVTDGLNIMGTKLKEIGTTVDKNSSKQAAFPNIDEMMSELNNGLRKMMQGQEKLKEGTTTLVNGYSNFGTQLKGVSKNLQNLSSSIQNSPNPTPEKQMQAQQLSQMSAQLFKLSEKMTMISKNSAALPTVPENTIKGLKKIKSNLGSKLGSINDMKENQAEQLANLKQLGNGLSEMGGNLITISENLGTMISYSDATAPSIPTTQRTIDKMVYDDNGQLRSMFKELITEDKYMTYIVKLKGNLDDTAKSNITASIKDFIKVNPVEAVETTVSGKPVLDNAVRTSMKGSMQKMMGLSVIFMIMVLLITFRVKWSLLPLAAILIAVVGTVGLMGWLNIPITMVSMAVFPILIGMGIDYSIQFQSRYVEETEVI